MLIKNARIVTREEEFVGVVRIDNGLIADVSRGTTDAADAEDWQGDYLVPGLVELHTDNLEKHLAPRPGVLWNVEAAFVIHDAQVAAAGITTVFDSLAIGTRTDAGLRGGELHRNAVSALDRLSENKMLRADHYLHLRCEVGTKDVIDLFDELGSHPLLRLASVMDHTPGQRQWHDPAKWRQYQERNGKWTDEKMAAALIDLTEMQARYAEAHRRSIVDRCKTLGIAVASHDDTTVEHVQEAVDDGIAISEFPTTIAAARMARENGLATIMGAPNVVRGGSHSGNVSALELAKAGLLDILSSDYVPSSLMMAAFQLVRDAGWSLPQAIATVSWSPAKSVGLTDRGAIEVGLRGDFVRVGVSGALPVPRATYVLGARVA
ncbi:MAG TPA: alpha-D-ribose 1-methylphosphonate 5-triphosphate diphosphatase [Trinickia sp.]|jgi:alpha-D-ribose 1-methylphosphonate 5-triphosphate diphosphatase|uniref:alpha-D-ribose 1-methylphosphonate 5-triphosphate diphosphatase n=1 Tax=Trinickia sp. TaxID=2571163 RepID=UPI002B741396|nr:alpha-D-ribose 1-methylphosphonate 5-triphosphate diphosphatase [Trinickia sp.]HTI17292.1 alpha-D-ribose 1-methylphosphonate 5-triphosphate diphosphatase [Trinickia sp.]